MFKIALLSTAIYANIHVLLGTKPSWEAPTFKEELIQTLARHTEQSIFDILDLISIGDETDAELYAKAMDRLSDYSETTIGYVKAALANHEQAPFIQQFYHYYRENVEGKECQVWVDFGGKFYCDEFKVDFSDWKQSKLLTFDHSFKQKLTERTAILYANIQHETFEPMLKILKSAAKKHDDFNFVLRFIPAAEQRRAIYLSGYGVELDVKNTEYKAVDDRKVTNEDDQDSITSKETDAKELLYEPEPSIQKLTKEQISEISGRAITFASESENKWDSLVQLTQNFPKYAHLLLEKSVNSDISRESLEMMQLATGEEQYLFMNGLNIDLEDINVFGMLRMMRTDTKVIKELESVGFSSSEAIDLISSPMESKSDIEWGACFNVKTDLAIWLNDIEKDAMYAQFPSGLETLMYPSHGNQFKFIRKNLFSALFVVDLTNPSVLMELPRLYQIIGQRVPIRFGILPYIGVGESDGVSNLVAIALYYIQKNVPGQLNSFLTQMDAGTDGEVVKQDTIRAVFQKVTGKPLDSIPENIELIQKLKSFGKRFGIDSNGAVFYNGKFSPYSPEWTKELLSVYFKMMAHLGQEYADGKFGEKEDFYDYFLKLGNVYQSRNSLIFTRTETDVVPVDYLRIPNVDSAFKEMKWIYGGDEIVSVSVIIVSDFSLESSKTIAKNALDVLKDPKVRLTYLDSNSKVSIHDALLQNPSVDGIKTFLKDTSKFTKQNTVLNEFVDKLPLVQEGTTIFINGRAIGPVTSFEPEDFKTLVGYESQKRIRNVANHIKSMHMDASREVVADLILKASGVLVSVLTPTPGVPFRRRHNSAKFQQWEDSSIFFSTGNLDTATIQFVAAIQPISNTGQKVLSILNALKEIPSVAVKVFAMAIAEPDSEKLPLNKFYRFQFNSEPVFNSQGGLAQPVVSFSRMPESALLTLGMDVPNAWLVRPKKSVYDLDNIKLSAIPKGNDLEAEFSLQSLLVQGHATDARTQGPPAGLQFILGTDKNPGMVDTITMANLGYFQLKGSPGLWNLNVRPGRSEQVYQIKTVDELSKLDIVSVDSFEGRTLYPMVLKKPGMEKENVLVEEGEKQDKGIWNQIKSSLFKQTEKNATINVFSVASGHLYERFLSIMMLSVKKQTKNPVKFWLIENFLSPSFLKFLPYLSKAFDFDYELVTYKWPPWLRKQTEKQRIIWGYKILFLDVLFPLNLDKVIFVDADQVVRTDLNELVEMDLKGAVYGYTPFCSSRKEMDGFRFWSQGYWKQHLRGRPYHISALYVIDLKKFRAVAAGDRLRGQYHALSADPHSLSNLDQDLPNNMIHEIPIFSLPQDWLWCETWCSDESLKTAKTIDLCNNPLTKEPKLDRAKRILPEWEGLDDEVAQVRKRYEAGLPVQVPVKMPAQGNEKEGHGEL